MKKLNLKVGIAAFSVMLVGLVTAAVMTFNFADSENPLNLASVSDAVYADAAPTTTTMIDRIIENSHASDAEDKNYHIVEITSGSSSNFVNFMTDSGFRELIFNQHSTTGKNFATDARITYDCYTASTVTAADVQGADLIYISEDPNKKYSKTNDIPTDLVSVLSNFAVGDYKPLIIDTTGGKNNGGNDSTINYATLYRNVLKNKRRYSLEYPHGKTPTDYIKNATTSLWLPIHGKDTSANWMTNDDDGKKIASIVTFTDTTSTPSTEFMSELRVGATEKSGIKVGGVEQTGVYAFAELPEATRTRVYVSSEVKPEYVKFDTKEYSAVVSEADLAKYDLVIFDDSCENKAIDKDTYLAIRSYELSRGHIVYDTELKVDSSSTSSISTDINTDAQNYKTILSKVSQSGKPSYSNIFVTNRGDFNTLITNVIPDAYDNNIVYIINNGSFRGLGGSGDASNKFTLLEIEPAYPIDTFLEKYLKSSGIAASVNNGVYKKAGNKDQYYYHDGWYYLNTMNILNGPTSDEISFDGGETPISIYDSSSSREMQVPREVGTETYEDKWIIQDKRQYNSGDVIAVATEADLNSLKSWPGGNDLGKDGDLFLFQLTSNGIWLPKDDGMGDVYLKQSVEKTTIVYDTVTKTGLAAAGTNVTDYYAWKWSRAKLAFVTGKSYDEVEVVHMSSAEFNASLDSLNDTYDMIYIGGDNSAVKPVHYWFKNSGNGNLVHEIYSGIGGYSTYAAFFKDFPAYNMYFTVGDTYTLEYDYADNQGNTITKGSVDATSGNDLTNNRYNDLKSFADSGRPVIIGKDLYEAVTFDLSQSLNLNSFDEASMAKLDNKVDPESNMYKLVSSLISSSKTNIVKNFDFDDIYRADNSGKEYGNTIGDFVTVFRRTVTGDGNTDCNADGVDEHSESLVRDYNGVRIDNYSVKTSHNGVQCTNGNDVYKTFKSSSQRPKYIVESAPVLYSTGEFLPTHTLKFKVKLSESSPDSKARIYIDDNGDGKFTSDEKISSDVALIKGQSVTVSANLKADFSGPVFWKLEVVNTKNEKDSASVTGVSAVKTSKKQPIDILQILPSEAGGKTGAPDAHIFLCKDCQESLQILTGGRLMGTGSGYNHVRFHDDLAREFIYNQKQSTDDKDYGNPGFTGENLTPDIEEPTAENYGFSFNAYTDTAGSTNLDHGTTNYKQVGVHEHKFGFAAIQDQAVNGKSYYIDDFNLNLFDNASDMYDIRLTILTIDELNELADKKIPQNLNKASIDDYQNLSDKYYRYFSAMSDILDGEDASKYSSTVSEFLDLYDSFKPSLKDASTIKTARDSLRSDTVALSNDYTNGVKYFTNDKGSPTQAEYKEIIDNIVLHETYEDLYFYNVGYASIKVGTYKSINKNFVIWRNAKVLEQYFYQKHIYYQILASGGKLRETITPANADSGNKGAFGLVVLGAAEHFANTNDPIGQKATEMIVDYASTSKTSSVDVPGDILLFHNTLTNNNAGTYFSNEMRPIVGMNTSNERISNVTRINSASPKLNLAKVELTDDYGNFKESKNQGSFLHKYSVVLFTDNSGPEGVDISNPDFDALDFYSRKSPDIMTDYAQCSSTTKGIMTSFPNAISNKIKISGTHQQTYTLNIPDRNLTVWYSLAGGTDGTDSSILVSDYNDHANNYYLYTYNNVTFFGAGHMYHTGLNRLNSEESKLIINAILNSSRPSAMSDDTKLELVTHKNKNYPLTPVSDESTEYKMYQYETTYSPDKLVDFEFGIDASTDKSKGITIKYLDIFFDLDYDPAVAYDHTYNGDKDISVYGNEFDQNGNRRTDVTTPFKVNDKTQNLVHTSGDGQYLDANGNLHNFIDEILNSTDDVLYIDSKAFNGIFKNLTLRDEYFVYGSGDYTYLSVVITDSKGNQVTKTIKIKKAPFLFDIT